MANQTMTKEDIQHAIKRAGSSQAEIAATCEVAPSIVSRVIDGTTTSHNVRCEIARVIKRKPEEIWNIPKDPHKRGPRGAKSKPQQLG